jgi:hypothetical protein
MTGADVRGLDETLGIPLIWGPGPAAQAVVVMFTDALHGVSDPNGVVVKREEL